MSFTVGENVGPYRIIEQLGQGGMATVYKAYHAALDRYVALKVLHPDLGDDPNFAARFQREARLVAKLEHLHIVPVHDFAVHEKHSYLVMKFIEGETLKARLGRGPLRSEEVRQIVDAVGAALAYAHEQGILHRDVKPSNVLITSSGHTYLADFGLARIAQAGESTLSSDAIIGTPQYISPEQAIGQRDLDEGTDIYSFGVMLYEMVVGQVPFSADTPFAIIHDHIYSPLPLPRVANPSVPEAVERVLLKALAKERADRYKTIKDMVAAFKSAWEAAGVPMQGTGVMLPKKSAQTPVPVSGAKLSLAGNTPASGSARVSVSAHRPAVKRSPWPWISIAAGAVLFLCCSFGGLALLPSMLNRIQSPPVQTSLPTQTAIMPTEPTQTPIPRPQVVMADLAQAQRMMQQEAPPFLAQMAIEDYSSEELIGMSTVPYTINWSESGPLSWGMGWCTTTQSILDQNFEHITYTFRLEDEEISLDQFVKEDYFDDDMKGYCRQYYTILTDWQPGEYHIQTLIRFDAGINDGWDDYLAGTTTYNYTVRVSP